MNTRDALFEIARDAQAQPYSKIGQVTAVDQEALTCDVSLSDGGADAMDVRLTAAGPDHRGLHLVPKVGSTGVITWLSENVAYLALCSDLDYALIDVGTTRLQINAEGVLLEKGTDNLRKVLQDLLGELRTLTQQVAAITVATPAGPSGVPNNVASITPIVGRLATIETSIQNLLND